jgi:hypothetical protein
MPERATTPSLAYTSRSTSGAADAEGNVPQPRHLTPSETLMRGHTPAGTAPGRGEP